MSKEPAVKRRAKKPAAKKPTAKVTSDKRAEAVRVSIPTRKRSASVEALLSLAGSITEEEAEVLKEALRLSRSEDCEA